MFSIDEECPEVKDMLGVNRQCQLVVDEGVAIEIYLMLGSTPMKLRAAMSNHKKAMEQNGTCMDAHQLLVSMISGATSWTRHRAL